MLKTLIALPLLIAAAPAIAQDAPVARVSYADLDLGSAAGRAQLEHRIQAAVRLVCEDPKTRDLRREVQNRGCRDTALANAAAQREKAFANAGQTAFIVR
ncbi:UrcA family protein [Sphingomonas canadensis]|uniref:UrcA family protein n=1 Tax=Sphingomonas canadensis TaxID=1219257 RepID=A0ABW3HGB4_9SPHN|nr:UrcA family protein [Sphingomonas canadensis]MCW3838450.1 UrcA family protein [Sphingomonas canadensis]